MSNIDKLNIYLGLIKSASPRWAKVLAAIPNEADKISWLRNFIPKNVGVHSVNKKMLSIPNTFRHKVDESGYELAKAVANKDTPFSDLLSKFKRHHRLQLKGETMEKMNPSDKGTVSPFRAGKSWLRDWNKKFPDKRVDPNQLVPFSHGGTINHLENFLKGEGGYLTDSGAKGIMITPNNLQNSRDALYAQRASRASFDTPAVLSGYIPSKYLKTSRNFGYESNLPTKYYDKIVNPSIQQISV